MGRVVKKKSGQRRRKRRIVVSKKDHCFTLRPEFLDSHLFALDCSRCLSDHNGFTAAKAAVEKLYVSTLNSLCDNLVNLSERFMRDTHFIHVTG